MKVHVKYGMSIALHLVAYCSSIPNVDIAAVNRLFNSPVQFSDPPPPPHPRQPTLPQVIAVLLVMDHCDKRERELEQYQMFWITGRESKAWIPNTHD